MSDRAIVRAGTRVEVAVSIFLFLCWLAFLVTASTVDAQIFLLATSVIWIYSIVESFGRLRTCWIADSISIRMERNGVVCWECPWEEFAGYWIKRVPWYRFKAKNRFVVLDRNGVERGFFVLPEYRYRDSAFFRRTLEHNTPKEFLPRNTVRKPLRKPKPLKTVAFGVSFWLIACVLLRIWGGERTGLQIFAIASMLTIAASLLFLSLHDWLRVRGPGASDRLNLRPVFGPSFREWRLERIPASRHLEEGKIYGYVDCHNRARFAEEDAKFFVEGRYFFLLLLLFGFLPLPDALQFALTMLPIFVAIWCLSGVIAHGIRLNSRRFHDRIRLEGSTLVVTGNGKERRFDWSHPTTTRFRCLDGWFGLRQKADGYSLDPRDLIEMPSEADIAEMLETHQRIEAMV